MLAKTTKKITEFFEFICLIAFMSVELITVKALQYTHRV